MKILWINCRLLHPLNGGDRIRTYNMLKQLKRKHHITYLSFCSSDDGADAKERASEFCHELITVPFEPPRNGSLKFFAGVLWNSFFGDAPFMVEKYRSAELADHVQRLAASGKVDLFICDYLASMINLAHFERRLGVPVIIFQHNVESQIWKRHADCTSNPIKRLIFYRQWQLTCAWEKSCAALVDGQVTVSEDDFQFFKQQGMTNLLGAVPTGVDLEYFSPSQKNKQPHSLVFLGSMDWMPNIDAACHFVEKIFPEIKKRFSDASFTIVGRNPTQRIKDLQANIPGVRVTGTVPDVRPYLNQAEVMIVPLKVGGGTRIKIYEGMAAGIPVVSTTVGAEGLSVIHGENIFLADSANDFGQRICELFDQPELRTRIGHNGRTLVERHFSWETVTKLFEKHCLETRADRKN